MWERLSSSLHLPSGLLSILLSPVFHKSSWPTSAKLSVFSPTRLPFLYCTLLYFLPAVLCPSIRGTLCTVSLTDTLNAALPVLNVKSKWNLIYLLLLKQLWFNRTWVWPHGTCANTTDNAGQRTHPELLLNIDSLWWAQRGRVSSLASACDRWNPPELFTRIKSREMVSEGCAGICSYALLEKLG